MNHADFCYWLKGFYELAEHADFHLTHEQMSIISKHAKLIEKTDGRLDKSVVSFLKKNNRIYQLTPKNKKRIPALLSSGR